MLNWLFYGYLEDLKFNVVIDSYLENFKVDVGNIFDILEIKYVKIFLKYIFNKLKMLIVINCFVYM